MTTTAQDLVQVTSADVHKAGRMAARLERDGSHVAFRYLDDYDGPAVATNLAQDVDGLPAGAVPPYFAGLLPEGRRLAALRAAVKTSADDELTLLLAVGGDTVGDVQIAPSGTVPSSPAPRFVPHEATETRFMDLLSRSVGGDIDTVGLPGVQEKVSARAANRPIRAHARSDAILKLQTADFPLLVDNEATCLDLAQGAGIPTPDHQRLVDRDGTPGLLVSRFDRIVEEHDVRALAQQDGCQTLGLWPADKYRPDLTAVINALAEHCASPVVAALRLWEQVLFAWLVGNGDLHAKNLSIRFVGDGWQPTPIYDVVFTHPYGDTDTMALPIAGQQRTGTINKATFLAGGEATGVRAPAMEMTINRLLDRTTAIPARLASLDFPGANARKLERVLANRRARLSA